MNICSEAHEEIVYETRNCPMCLALEEIRELEQEVEKCDEANSELQAKITTLEEELAASQSA